MFKFTKPSENLNLIILNAKKLKIQNKIFSSCFYNKNCMKNIIVKMEKKDTHFRSAVNTMTILTFLFLLFYIFEKGEVLGKTIARIGFQIKNYLNLYFMKKKNKIGYTIVHVVIMLLVLGEIAESFGRSIKDW